MSMEPVERTITAAAGRSGPVCRILMAVATLWLGGVAATLAQDVCEATARDQHKACRNEVADDFWEEHAICRNISAVAERNDCFGESRDAREEAKEECDDVLEAREELCEELGGGRHDPDLDPDDFETEFTNLNPYWPLAVGNLWVYEGGEEVITVEVQDATKLIEGVTCIVVNDQVEDDGELVEDTDDWYAQASNGDLHYCGEIAQNFETFEGDDPEEPELVDVEGSFKAGRDGAKSGILIHGAPQVGETYRQEWAAGDAEDAGQVLVNDYGFGNDDEFDQLVPEELAELLCDDDCVVTRDFTPIEPGVEERKYYAPGIGLFLEVNLEDEEIVQLVACNVDPICDELPEVE